MKGVKERVSSSWQLLRISPVLQTSRIPYGVTTTDRMDSYMDHQRSVLWATEYNHITDSHVNAMKNDNGTLERQTQHFSLLMLSLAMRR